MDKNRWFACAKEAGFESFEIYQLLNEERSFTWFEGELDSYVTSHVLGTAFRGVIDSKMVNASSEDTSDDQMEDVIASMKQQAQMISNEEKADLRKPEEIKQEDKQIPVSANADVIRELLGETEKKILAFDERIFQVTDLVYEESRTIRTIVNTYGMDLKEVSGINVLVAGAAAKENEEIRNHYEFEPVDDAASFDSDDFVKQLCEKTVGKLGASTPASGEYPVIIERGAFTQLFGAYSSMFCGDAFRKGISPLCGKLNEKIFSEEIEIIDDPNDSRAVQRYAFDDEGCPAKRKTVVEKGVLKTILHDETTARAAGTESTGNGFRSGYSTPVDARVMNFGIENGPHTPDELMAIIHNGILITDFAGLHAGLNHVTGDFSLQCSGYAVKDGKKAEGLTLFTAAGNIISLLDHVTAIGNDRRWGAGSVSCPSIAFESLSISGS